MATRRSLRLRSNSNGNTNTKLLNLDQFRHSNGVDIDMSDSNKNTNSEQFVEDEVSSASSEEYEEETSSEEEESESENSESSYSDTQESENNNEQDESDSNDMDRSSDSDYEPGKKKTKKKITKKKKVNTNKKRGRKRKRSDDDSDDMSDSGDLSGSDEEYKPNGQTRKRRKTIKKNNNNSNNNAHIRRSTRNLGRNTVKYDDVTLYGAIPGLYDSDANEKEAAKKTYKNVAKKRKRGGIKKLNRKKNKNSNNNESTSQSQSPSPNKPKIKITHKAWKKKQSKDMDSDDMSNTNSQHTNQSSQSISPAKEALYTYSSWLDDIVSDTECKYLSRGRLMPAKINHVEYEFEVQTSVGCETYAPESGKIKACVQTEENKQKENENENENKMEVDQEDNDQDDDINDEINDINDDDNREWYHKLSVGDSIQCYNEPEDSWNDCKIIFINRRFDLQYHMRKSLNTEQIYEYDPKTQYINTVLKTKMRPSSTVPLDVTPEPILSPSPKKKKKGKKNRFGDSDESEEEDSDQDSEEESESESQSQSQSQSRTHSISPMDDLQTKIEIILFKMKLPKDTVSWTDTFNHLNQDGESKNKNNNNAQKQEAQTDTNANVNSKEEMDIDNGEHIQNNIENVSQVQETTPTIDEKQADKDAEMEDKENNGPINKENKEKDENNNNDMMIESDEEEDDNMKKKDALVDKYLVKYWNRSYHHLEWLTTRQLRELDAETKRVNFEKKFDEYDRKVKKINNAITQKKYKSVHFFNELYLEIDRIISYAEPGENFDTVSGYTSSNKLFQININTSNETMYLVKWKGMPYDAASWEMESFLKDDAFENRFHGTKEIELLIRRQKIPPSRYLHPAPKRLNSNYFKNKPKTKERIIDGQIFKNGHKLRGNYQHAGANWLINNWQYKVPCILADEMGLGKTVQTVTFINWLYEKYHRRGPFLIVAPLSTLGHWQREFRGWSDLNVIVYHGSASSRDRIVHEEFEWLWTDRSHPRAKNTKELKKLNANNFKFNVMITTPQIVNQDYKILNAQQILWNTIVVDEAHSLKSDKSLFYRTLTTFKNPYTHTVLLTGTPIQNNMEELWCLLHFMDPNSFQDQEEFAKRFSNLAESKAELKELLDVRLLQRLKYLVEKDLCQREEKIIWVELTLFQKKWYKALYQRSYEKLRACGAAKASLMNVAMQLRKCCNHPFLMTDVEKTMSPPGTDDKTMNENLIASSGKLVLLDKLLPKLKNENHRILIFSQMSHLLDILEDYLNYRQHLYERLDGSVTGIERQEAIDRFQKDDGIFVFLLTTRAGGVGINLMAADTVIIYDSDWNPMNDVQAIARCHRIGQKKQVNVYRLITRNCYEESMFKRADQKLALNKVVMGDMKDMGKSDINNMLKKGAISMFLRDVQTDEDIKKFANADIDEILAGRTETIKHDANTNDPDAAMFSEAVFVAHANDADVNVDDENFWEVLGIGKDDEEEQEIYTSPFMRRRRTRLQSRNANFNNANMYDSDGYSLDGVEFGSVDDGTSLLGALSYIIYGKWQQIYDDLTHEEKVHLKLVKDDENEFEEEYDEDDDIKVVKAPLVKGKDKGNGNDNDDDDKKENEEKIEEKKENENDLMEKKIEEENKVKDWQIEILKQASVETICKMANLMRPNIRNQKLGVNFSRLQTLFYDKEWRNDAIHTLAQQIYEHDMMRSDEWRKVIGQVWQHREEKNRFVDRKQLRERPYLCKMGCLRLNNKSVNPNSGHKYDTCCSNCGNNTEKKKDLVHEPYCEKRHYNDFRVQIRDEALKTYLNKNPLQIINNNNTNNAIASKMNDDVKDVENNNSNSNSNNKNEKYTQYIIPAALDHQEMIDTIQRELKYHDTNKIVLSMRTKFINVKSLRDELKNKTHGDIVSILLKLERMFKFKIMAGLHKGKIKKLDFSNKKTTKAMPEWWEEKWNHCMVEGTLKYGWGNIPAQFAREQYEFTPIYKGFKKVKKPTKKQLEQQKLKDIKNGMQKVQINSNTNTTQPPNTNITINGNSNSNTNNAPTPVAVAAPVEPPVLIVKKRQWVAEGKKQETILISICNHFRKEIREKYKKVTTKIKTQNKLREQRILHPPMDNHNNIGSLNAEIDDMIKHKKTKRRKKARKDKLNREKSNSKKNAFPPSQFNKENDITNYFSTSKSNSNNGKEMKNAFDILGKKKKKKKNKYVKTKLTIAFDENGGFKVPIKISRAKMITNLGEISTEKGYHATSYIYPIGFKCVNASLPSIKRPGQSTTFTTIIKRGEKGPLFEITCSDDPDFRLCEKNPSKVWGQLKQHWLESEDKKNNENDNNNTNNTNNNENDSKNNSLKTTPTKRKSSGHGVSGPQKMGLAHHDIKRVIECLPNALKCSNYKFKYRQDNDHTLSSKKAFRKTLKIKKDKSEKNKNNNIKSPKKQKSAKKTHNTININTNTNSNNTTTINNINNIHNINIINNIGSGSGSVNNNIITDNSVHTISSMANTNSVGAMSNPNDPILIEDSPTNPSIGNANGNANGGNVSNMNISSLNTSRNGSEVIDLCESDNEQKAKAKAKPPKPQPKVQKQNRKRKHPSQQNNNAFKDDTEQPKKKRRIDNKKKNKNKNKNKTQNKQQKLSAMWS